MKPSSKMSACQRAGRYKEAELEIRRRLKGKGGKTAKEVAQELGWPWRVVARALTRMSTGGAARRDEQRVDLGRGRVTMVGVYEIRGEGFDMDSLPAWLRGAVTRQTEDGKG